jgi:hypothetical protein
MAHAILCARFGARRVRVRDDGPVVANVGDKMVGVLFAIDKACSEPSIA